MEVVTSAENTAPNQRGRPFEKGRSGNPAGKPRGARNRATLAAEALLDGQCAALTKKAIDLALEGDTIALRLCLERVVPKRHERPIQFAIPPLHVASDAIAAIDAISAGVARGELSASEAGSLIALVNSFRETLSAVDHEARLAALEGQLVKAGGRDENV
jgi:hypothetical protein